jgi:hypothetical protein
MATACYRPARTTHVLEVKIRPRFVETIYTWKISHRMIINPPTLVPYASSIGTCIEALPQHVQRLVGDIPELMTPTGWDPTTPVDIIIATDGSVTSGVVYHISVTFGVVYHSWVIATADEDILTQGGGPDDGDLFLMTSYRSELGGVAVGLALIGNLSRSGLINIASTTCLCDNESTVLSTKRPLPDSIFHHLEDDHNLVSRSKTCRRTGAATSKLRMSGSKDTRTTYTVN